MSSPNHNNDAASSTSDLVSNGPSREADNRSASERLKPPAKRPASSAVIEISDTESDDSDICAVSSYQASADEVKRIRGGQYSMFFIALFLLVWAGISNFVVYYRYDLDFSQRI